VPRAEVFNTYNNRNNLNRRVRARCSLSAAFLWAGVADPMQSQLSLRFVF